MKKKTQSVPPPQPATEPARKHFQSISGVWISTYPDGTFVTTLPDGEIRASETFAALKLVVEEFVRSAAEEAGTNHGPKKLSSFEDNVRGDYYHFNPFDYRLNKEQHRQFENSRWDEFVVDSRKYLLESGVPNQYVDKCYYRAWEDGHSGGYSEVLNHLYDMIEIFK